MYDVAIMGAGPAGTAAAFDLLENGFTVLILDKYKFPRKKACAGGITPKCLDAFAFDISKLIKNTCKTVRIKRSYKKAFIIKNKKPLCYMVNRKELDFFSLNTVIKKGAVFKWLNKIQKIQDHSTFIQIQTDTKSYKARYLIGADGANSVVRRYFVKDRFYSKQMGIEADLFIDRPEKYHMEFDFSFDLKGYYWIFPKDDHVNIGIYSVGCNDALKIKMLSDYAFRRFGTRALSAVKGYPICSGGFAYRSESRRVFLVGDAAGMGERTLGEGIYFAVKTGRLAANSIVVSQKTGRYAKNIYTESLKKIQRDLKLYNIGASILYRFKFISLTILSIRFFHNFLANGYAEGKSVFDILFFFRPKE